MLKQMSRVKRGLKPRVRVIFTRRLFSTRLHYHNWRITRYIVCASLWPMHRFDPSLFFDSLKIWSPDRTDGGTWILKTQGPPKASSNSYTWIDVKSFTFPFFASLSPSLCLLLDNAYKPTLYPYQFPFCCSLVTYYILWGSPRCQTTVIWRRWLK